MKSKVISFNIRMSHGNDGINSWDNRKELVLRTLRNRQADIIGMQEVTSEQFLFLKERLKDFHVYGVGRKDGKLQDEIMAIFYKSRYDVLIDSTVWLSQTPSVIGSKSWDAALYRTVSWLTLRDKVSGISFTVFNTHFDHRGKVARNESAKLIMRLIPEASDGSPAILMGDFNVTKEEEPYQILTAKWKECYQLKDARYISENPHLGGEISYNGYKDNFGRIIDFLFVSDGIEVKSHQYLNVKDGNIFISDHYPVESELEITKKKIVPGAFGKTLE